MARKYTRDNRGRFASKGSGATARGGRLKTASGNKRQTQTVKATKRSTPSGAIRKTDVITARVQNGISKHIERRNRAGLNPPTAAKENQTSRLARAERRIAERGKAAAARPDTAMANIPMAGTRGRRLDAEISRNVKAQKATARAADKTRNRQFQSDQSRAKKLRAAHVGAIAKAKGISKGQVESALKAQSPSTQIKALKNWVKQNRGAAKPAAKAGAKRSKTDLQVMQQADRLMGKLAKRQASVNVGKVGLNEGLRQVRRNNARAGRINAALNSRGLLGKYNKLTAPADGVHMTPAGPGIKPAAKRKAVGSITSAKADRIIARIDANRPGQRRVAGSLRKSQNASRTHQRATEFVLGASKRARSRGNSISVNESVRRAVSNAAKKRRR